MGGWLSQEARKTLRCPSKQGHKQLKSSSYLRGEWHGHFASWRQERSGAREVVERTEEEGQWQEGGGVRKEWSRTQWATAVRQPGGMEWEHPGPDHDPCCPWVTRGTPFLGPQSTVDNLPTQIILAWSGAICLTPPRSVGWSSQSKLPLKRKLAICIWQVAFVLKLWFRIKYIWSALTQWMKMHSHLNVFISPCFCSFAFSVFF